MDTLGHGGGEPGGGVRRLAWHGLEGAVAEVDLAPDNKGRNL